MKRIKILTKSSIVMVIIIAMSIFYNKVYAADLAVSASGSSVTISSEYTGRFNISVDGGTASESSVWLEGSSKTISISNVGENGATVTVTPVTVSDDEGNAKSVSAKSVKIAGSGSGNNTKKNNDETQKTVEKEPSFKSANDTMYATGNINVRKSYSADSDKVTTLKTGDKVTRTGIGDNGWSKISYDGGTGYVKTSLLTKDEPKKSEDKALKELTVTGYELEPAFDPEITDYAIVIKKEDEKLEVKATPNDEKATVEVTGNEELTDGANIIKVTVTAEDKTTRIYTINATKKEDVKLGLSSLKIEGYSLSPKFSADVFDYKVTILDPNVNSLKVNAVSNIEDATVDITGSSNLKVGENTILVNIKSKDGEQTATYKIAVTKNAAATTEKKKDWILYAGIGIIAVLILAIIIIVRKSKKNDDEYEEEEYDENNNYENLYGYSSKNDKNMANTEKENNEYNNFDSTENKKYIEDEVFGKIPEPGIEDEKPKYEDNFNYNAYNTKDMYEGYGENKEKSVSSETQRYDFSTEKPDFKKMVNDINSTEDGGSDSLMQVSNKDEWDYNDDDYRPRRGKGKHAK